MITVSYGGRGMPTWLHYHMGGGDPRKWLRNSYNILYVEEDHENVLSRKIIWNSAEPCQWPLRGHFIQESDWQFGTFLSKLLNPLTSKYYISFDQGWRKKRFVGYPTCWVNYKSWIFNHHIQQYSILVDTHYCKQIAAQPIFYSWPPQSSQAKDGRSRHLPDNPSSSPSAQVWILTTCKDFSTIYWRRHILRMEEKGLSMLDNTPLWGFSWSVQQPALTARRVIHTGISWEPKREPCHAPPGSAPISQKDTTTLIICLKWPWAINTIYVSPSSVLFSGFIYWNQMGRPWISTNNISAARVSTSFLLSHILRISSTSNKMAS